MFTSKLRSRKAHQQVQQGRKLFLEGLETRTLMAANLTATLDTSDKILRIEGTNAADSIVVRNSAGRVSVNGITIQVNNNGALSNPSSVSRNLVTRVEVKGLAGNDVITMNETGMTAGQGLPLFAWGGDGNDKLIGGSMADKLYGENGSDTLIGNAGNDQLFGGAGNDTLSGGTGNDNLLGGAGNDSLSGGEGIDAMNGGEDIDTLQGRAGYATLSDSEFKTWQNDEYTTDTVAGLEKATLTANDIGLGYTYFDAGNFSGSVILKGTSLADYFYGGAGNDQLTGLDGNDYLVGGGGDDTCDSGAGDDMIGGGLGADTLAAGEGTDTFFASSGYAYLSDADYKYWSAAISDYVTSVLSGFETANLYAIDEGYGYTLLSAQSFSGPVTLSGSNLNDSLYGGASDDTIYAYGGNDYLLGFGGNNTIYGGEDSDTIYSGDGHDVVYAGGGNDYVYGMEGSDSLNGEDGDDVLAGAWNGSSAEPGNDVLSGGNGNDVIYGGQGNDTLFGGYGNDIVVGEEGNDYAFGEADNDLVIGGFYGSSAAEYGEDFLCGGSGNDSVYGGYGNDLLFGEDGDDYVNGEAGRDKLFGGWGNDSLVGGTGNDRLSGEYGDDGLWGEDGNDELIGGQGTDNLVGGYGDDSLVAIDDGTTDKLWGESGYDTMWVDANWRGWSIAKDTTYTDSNDTVQYVFGFTNGADKTLNGDDIVDPSDATNLKDFSNNWLFADWGPSMNDVDQEALGDCWLMAAAGAVAYENPNQIREIVADFGDGTYGVKLGGKFYRVDADLPTWNASSTDQQFAGLGMQDSLWVAIVEKAYAHFRTGANTYASLNGGDPGTALAAYGVTDVKTTYHAPSSNDADAANNIYNAYRSWKPAVVSVGSTPSGSKLVGGHAYTVVAATRDLSTGVVTSITLRNPWGGDNTGGNPFVTVTTAELGECEIWVQWGNV